MKFCPQVVSNGIICQVLWKCSIILFKYFKTFNFLCKTKPCYCWMIVSLDHVWEWIYQCQVVFTEIWNRLQCVILRKKLNKMVLWKWILYHRILSLLFFVWYVLAGYKHLSLCDISSITVYEQQTYSMYLFKSLFRTFLLLFLFLLSCVSFF